MPKKENRVNSALFKEILKSGTKKHTQCATFIFLKNNENKFRFSVVVPKKVEKKAVKRNKIKRRAREIVKNYLLKNNIKNLDILLIIKKDESVFKFESLKKCIENLLKTLV